MTGDRGRPKAHEDGRLSGDEKAAVALLNELADVFFTDQLHGSWVPEYLAARGFSPAIQTRWHAGYAPATWDMFTRHLRALGSTDLLIERAGLSRRSSRGSLIDTFRDRAMLPIRSTDGTVAGFIGRAPDGAAADVPKYLNSPHTCLYDKSALPVAFDADAAGRQAAARAYYLLCPFTENLAAVDFQPSQDPAHILATEGPAALAEMVSKQTQPLADVVIDGEVARWDQWLMYAEGQINAMHAAAHLIVAMPPAHVGRQVARLASRFGLDYGLITEAVTDEVSKAFTPRPAWSPRAAPPPRNARGP